jgi:hypothetical protein
MKYEVIYRRNDTLRRRIYEDFNLDIGNWGCAALLFDGQTGRLITEIRGVEVRRLIAVGATIESDYIVWTKHDLVDIEPFRAELFFARMDAKRDLTKV